MRRLAPSALLILLLVSPAARAVPITGYAAGHITSTLGPTGGMFRDFTIGEYVILEFTYDPAEATGSPAGYRLPSATFRIDTYSANFSVTGAAGGGLVVVEDGPADRVDFGIGNILLQMDLAFTDPAGAAISSTALPTLADLGAFPDLLLTYSSTAINGGKGFVADMTFSTTRPAAPVPEPGTFLQGILGGIMLIPAVAMRLRRRRAG